MIYGILLFEAVNESSNLSGLNSSSDRSNESLLGSAFNFDELKGYGFFQKQIMKSQQPLLKVTTGGILMKMKPFEMISFSLEDLLRDDSADNANQGEGSAKKSEDVVGYAFRDNDRAGCVLCAREYPSRVAVGLIRKLFEEEKKLRQTVADSEVRKHQLDNMLRNYMVQYKDPTNADVILKVQKELDVTMNRTIESVLARGEKLDVLVDRSGQLNDASKMFYKSAKKTNSCCVVM